MARMADLQLKFDQLSEEIKHSLDESQCLMECRKGTQLSYNVDNLKRYLESKLREINSMNLKIKTA